MCVRIYAFRHVQRSLILEVAAQYYDYGTNNKAGWLGTKPFSPTLQEQGVVHAVQQLSVRIKIVRTCMYTQVRFFTQVRTYVRVYLLRIAKLSLKFSLPPVIRILNLCLLIVRYCSCCCLYLLGYCAPCLFITLSVRLHRPNKPIFGKQTAQTDRQTVGLRVREMQWQQSRSKQQCLHLHHHGEMRPVSQSPENSCRENSSRGRKKETQKYYERLGRKVGSFFVSLSMWI